MDTLHEYDIIDRGIEVQETLGSFKIFDETDPVDHPAIYQFIKIIFKYIKMSNANEKS